MKINFLGIPSNVGALNTGTELGPTYFRKAGLIEKLSENHEVFDMGDLDIDNVEFRHNIGPIRNWPSPRIMWEKIINFNQKLFVQDKFTLIVGGGCSVFTGVFINFFNSYGEAAQILSLDHHIDIKAPSPDQCIGATAFSLWFLTHDNPWIEKPKGFKKEGITSFGFDQKNMDASLSTEGMKLFDMDYIHSKGPIVTAQEYLKQLDYKSRVIIHLDLDVIRQGDISSVYMPSENGLKIDTLTQFLKIICRDQRIVSLVVTEFSPSIKHGLKDSQKLVEMLNSVLNNR